VLRLYVPPNICETTDIWKTRPDKAIPFNVYAKLNNYYDNGDTTFNGYLNDQNDCVRAHKIVGCQKSWHR
ncbi:hypothetical protein ACFL2D_00350, partial [Patescibacteria group bacterium]